MQSKVHPTYKTKYRVANWPAYNQALVRRGDVTVWVSSEAIAAWTARRSGRRAGPRRYSDLAIETALTLRLIYHLPLRQAEGFLHALFGIMRLDLSVPDDTTRSRRAGPAADGAAGRRCQGTIVRAGWRTRSSDTRPLSAMASGPGGQPGRGVRSPSRSSVARVPSPPRPGGPLGGTASTGGRSPPGQRRPLSVGHRPHAVPPANGRLRCATYGRRPHQT